MEENGRFKEGDFLLFQLRSGATLAILKKGPAKGLDFNEQSSRLPEGFELAGLAEIEAFLGSYEGEHRGCYPEVERVLVWTARTNRVNREALVIDSVCKVLTKSPQGLGHITAYTRDPIVVAAIREDA